MRRSKGKLSGRSKHISGRKRLGLKNLIKTFEIGEKVNLKMKPGYQDIPHPRFRGKTGEVIGRQGTAYIVEIRDMNKKKKLIVTPVHLEKVV